MRKISVFIKVLKIKTEVFIFRINFKIKAAKEKNYLKGSVNVIKLGSGGVKNV